MSPVLVSLSLIPPLPLCPVVAPVLLFIVVHDAAWYAVTLSAKCPGKVIFNGIDAVLPYGIQAGAQVGVQALDLHPQPLRAQPALRQRTAPPLALARQPPPPLVLARWSPPPPPVATPAARASHRQAV